MPPTPRVRFGSRRKNFSKIRSARPAGCRGPRRRRGSGRGRRRLERDAHAAAVGRVLDRVVDEVRRAPGAACPGRRRPAAAPSGASSDELDPRRARAPAARPRTCCASSRGVAALDRDAHLPGVEPARPEDVVDDPREPVGLARDHVEQPAPLRLFESRRRRAAASARRRRSRRAACAARATRSRRSRSSAGRPRAPRSGRGTRRRCRRGSGRRRSRATARSPCTSTGSVSARRAAAGPSRPGSGPKRVPVGDQRPSTGRPTRLRGACPERLRGGRVPEPDDAVASTRKTPSSTNSSASRGVRARLRLAVEQRVVQRERDARRPSSTASSRSDS